MCVQRVSWAVPPVTDRSETLTSQHGGIPRTSSLVGNLVTKDHARRRYPERGGGFIDAGGGRLGIGTWLPVQEEMFCVHEGCPNIVLALFVSFSSPLALPSTPLSPAPQHTSISEEGTVLMSFTGSCIGGEFYLTKVVCVFFLILYNHLDE